MAGTGTRVEVYISNMPRKVFEEMILVVEDNETLARSISRCLHRRGHETEAVTTLLAARQVLRERRVTAVCLDLQLPDGNGLELLEIDLRPAGLMMPAVLVTGAGSDADRARAKRSGALAFLTKPFALSELGSIFDRALNPEMNSPDRTQGENP